ncbi:DUF3450 domain-containing protein [Celerinatantimonas sp. YJH-8]|uniref:DUF3450 domain-containing protein n=1 Tax=Celerinatantimonas sp. YJH-8 TaxID=3228714 RepID=UPI0038C18CB2
MLKFFFKNMTALAIFSYLSGINASYAAELSQSQQQVEQAHQQDVQTQITIDKLDERTRSDLANYQQNQRQADLVEAYNQQLEKMIVSQQQEQQRVNQQLDSLDETEQTALPMLVTLFQQLKDFVAQDQPFLAKERQQRLARLQRIIDRADVSLAEKYRQVLDAYQVEIDYASSIGSYQGTLSTAQGTTQVRYFRLGRTAFYYQTLDRQSGALWQPASQSWQTLTDTQNRQLTTAIAVAEKQKVPQLLNLPLPAPQEPRS